MVQSSNDFLFEAKLIAQREYVKREFNRARKMSFYTLVPFYKTLFHVWKKSLYEFKFEYNQANEAEYTLTIANKTILISPRK